MTIPQTNTPIPSVSQTQANIVRPAKTERWPSVPVWLFLFEISILLGMTGYIGANYVRDPPNLRLASTEFERMTSATYYANLIYHQDSYLPLWQPFITTGEPVIDNPFSFVLNPVTTGPTLLPDNPYLGMRISVVLTLLIASAGGWVLGVRIGQSHVTV